MVFPLGVALADTVNNTHSPQQTQHRARESLWPATTGQRLVESGSYPPASVVRQDHPRRQIHAHLRLIGKDLVILPEVREEAAREDHSRPVREPVRHTPVGTDF